MTTGDIILHIFCLVDDTLPYIAMHPQAKLYPSELVTIGILFSLKGGFFRAFYRWLKRDYGDWSGKGELPERTRLQRLLKTHQDWCDLLMADPSFFTMTYTYPIELIFPSMVTLVCDLKRIRHRVADYIQARMAYVSAMFNILLGLFHQLHPEADPFQMSIAEFSL
jgi:hypothetical protein